jgi:hypothetical protein
MLIVGGGRRTRQADPTWDLVLIPMGNIDSVTSGDSRGGLQHYESGRSSEHEIHEHMATGKHQSYEAGGVGKCTPSVTKLHRHNGKCA